MWSSVTERRIGTAGVSSTAVAGSSDASPLSVSKTDWISAATSDAGDGVVADMRRDDLGRQGEKLAAIDALVCRPFASSARFCPSNSARLRRDMRARSNTATRAIRP